MTTLVPFAPSTEAAFTFQPTLDGQTYNAVVTWNTYALRYYISVYDLQGNLQFSVPLVSSPPVVAQVCITNGDNTITMLSRNIAIIAGMEVTGPLIQAGTYVQSVMQNMILLTQWTLDDESDEPYDSMSEEPSASYAFTYSINLAKGYFSTPLVYRGSQQQFEIG